MLIGGGGGGWIVCRLVFEDCKRVGLTATFAKGLNGYRGGPNFSTSLQPC
jgi:hypothetical protein